MNDLHIAINESFRKVLLTYLSKYFFQVFLKIELII